MIALLTLAPVLAADVTASAAVGWEAPLRQAWSGVEVSLHPTNDRGVALTGSAVAGWGFAERSPLGLVELGFVHFVPSQRGLVRVGLSSRTAVVSLPYTVPVRLAEGPERRFGLVPGFVLHVAFQSGRQAAPFLLTVRAGMQSTVFNIRCPDPGDLTNCGVWDLAFVGGVGVEKRFEKGFSVEARLGPTSRLAIGHRF